MPTNGRKKTKPNETERSRYWRDAIASWEASGLKASEYCRREGLSIPSFFWWKSELQRRSTLTKQAGADGATRTKKTSSKPAPPTFLAVTVPPLFPEERDAEAIEVILPRGHRLRIPPGFHAETLHRLIQLLESSC